MDRLKNTVVFFPSFSLQGSGNARDAIRTHEPLQERILSPSELAGLSYPRALNYYPSGTKKNPIQKDCLVPVRFRNTVGGRASGGGARSLVKEHCRLVDAIASALQKKEPVLKEKRKT